MNRYKLHIPIDRPYCYRCQLYEKQCICIEVGKKYIFTGIGNTEARGYAKGEIIVIVKSLYRPIGRDNYKSDWAVYCTNLNNSIRNVGDGNWEMTEESILSLCELYSKD